MGSMPGRIINGLKTVAVNNPVFLLDEVDKLGKSLQGDPAAALLEVSRGAPCLASRPGRAWEPLRCPVGVVTGKTVGYRPRSEAG